MTDNYPYVPHHGNGCLTRYQILAENKEINLTLLDVIILDKSNSKMITVCDSKLYLHSYNNNDKIERSKCTKYGRQEWDSPPLSWVLPSTFNIVIDQDAPRGLMFEYKGESYILLIK